MNATDEKLNEVFAGLVVRKDLAKIVKGNVSVPNYVLEYLLGQYCATSEEEDIQAGVEQVKDILAQHFVQRSEAELVKSTIKERGQHRVIDKILVSLNQRSDCYVAEFSNLGINNVIVESSTVKMYPKLLVNGVWCLVNLTYDHSEDVTAVPWVIKSLKPIQHANFDMDSYLEGRAEFTLQEWIDVLIRTVGFEPDMLNERNKLFILTRLIPYVERNYNLIELGPKGTGKSHIYSDFSPHGILLSGGEVSIPRLFVNNTNGRLGLVGYWDTIAFDEFAGKDKKPPKALVDIMKNYMANKSFSRGNEMLSAEGSFAFEGNTSHNVPYMLRYSDLFDDLPTAYHDSAFMDRLHTYIPGWEVNIIRSELFTSGYGFIIDYLAEALRNLRKVDFSAEYEQYFEVSNTLSTRDKEGVRKTFSGLMKILFPGGGATKEEIETLLHFAMEGRKRVKDQEIRIDATFIGVDFSYRDNETGEVKPVKTLEEIQYPDYYYQIAVEKAPDEENGSTSTEKKPAGGARPSQHSASDAEAADETVTAVSETPQPPVSPYPVPAGCEKEFQSGELGFSYDKYIGPYLKGAKDIEITDPYINMPYQFKHLAELMMTILKQKEPSDYVIVMLHTKKADYAYEDKQEDNLNRLRDGFIHQGIDIDWDFDKADHDRWIKTDTGWTLNLGRGLDVFENCGDDSFLNATSQIQELRPLRAFKITYLNAPGREG